MHGATTCMQGTSGIFFARPPAPDHGVAVSCPHTAIERLALNTGVSMVQVGPAELQRERIHRALRHHVLHLVEGEERKEVARAVTNCNL